MVNTNKTAKTSDKQKTYKVTISGSYKASDGDIESFDNVVGVVPAMDDDKLQQMVIRRYAPIWVAQARQNPEDPNSLPKYKRIQRIRNVYIDSIDVNEDKRQLSYIGKDILQMNFEEIQDLAAANDLSEVPLYKSGSLTHARRVAWSAYAIKVLGMVEYVDPKARIKQNIYDFRTTGFNPNRFEPIIADGQIRRSSTVGMDIEEAIDRANPTVAKATEAAGNDDTATETRMSLGQLKAVADAKGVEYHATIGFNQLYEKIYGKRPQAA